MSILFKENFDDGNLAVRGWVGKEGTVPDVDVVVDPKDSANYALTFIRVIGAGDLFSPLISSPSNNFLVCGRYLSIEKAGANPSNSGGYMGYSYSTPGTHYWKVGTGSASGASDILSDNREWGSFEFSFVSTAPIRIMMEDAHGVAGDAHFDDIIVLDPSGDSSGINSCSDYWVYESSSQGESDVNDGLVAYYPLDGDSNDVSGYKNHGVGYNIISIADLNGISNSAYQFNGVDSKIIIQNSASLEVGYSDYSIAAWIRPDAVHVGRIFSKGSSNCVTGYMMRTHINNEVFLENAYNGVCKTVLISDSALILGKWSFVVGVVDRDVGAKIYINGIIDKEVSIDTSSFSFSNSRNAVIGLNDVHSTEAFNGAIDNLQIYNRALSADEILQKYNADEFILQCIKTGELIVSSTLEDVSCKINNIHLYEYLKKDCFGETGFYWNIIKQDSGYFYIKDAVNGGYLVGNDEDMVILSTTLTGDGHDDWFIAKEPLSGYFRIQNKLTGKYLDSVDGSVTVLGAAISDSSIWDITGGCDFITKHEYVKFKSKEELESKDQCRTKVILEQIGLISSPMNGSQDTVQFTVDCGFHHSIPAKNFTTATSMHKYNESTVCDSYNMYLDLAIVVGSKGYALEVPKEYYSAYPTDTKIRYKINKQELNDGKIEIITFNASADASCNAAGDALAEAEVTGSISAICQAVSIAKTQGSSKSWWGKMKHNARTVIESTCSAYAEGRLDADARASFQATCEAHFEAQGSVVVEKFCIVGGASSNLKTSVNFDWNAFSDTVYRLFDLDANSIFSSSFNGCANVNMDPKYKVDIVFASDNKPYCWTYQDYIFPRVQNLTSALDCRGAFWDGINYDIFKAPEERGRCAIDLNLNNAIDIQEGYFVDFTKVAFGRLHNKWTNEAVKLNQQYPREYVDDIEYVVTMDECPATGCSTAGIEYTVYKEDDTYTNAQYEVMLSSAIHLAETTLAIAALIALDF